MAKLAIILLGLTAVVVQGAVIKSEDAPLNRIARSPCPTCGGPPYGPPPPPFFHTHNWSGYSKGPDGQPRGVFSGAAATAIGGLQDSGQAFSLAASEAGDQNDDLSNSRTIQPTDGGKSAVGFGGQSNGHFAKGGSYKESHLSGGNSKYSGGFSGNGGFGHGGEQQSQSGRLSGNGGFGHSAEQQSQSSGFSGSEGFAYGGKQQSQSGGLSAAQPQSSAQAGGPSIGAGFGDSSHSKFIQGKESQFSSGGSNHQSGGFGNGGFSHGDEQQQSQPGGFVASGAQSSSQAGGFGQGVGSAQEGASSGLQHQVGFGGGIRGGAQGGYNGKYEASGSFGNGQQSQDLQSGFNSHGQGSLKHQESYNEAQSALSTAQGLASQGLQASGQAGCSTCGKSNYALSNAKSKSGNAIAVSVGGK